MLADNDINSTMGKIIFVIDFAGRREHSFDGSPLDFIYQEMMYSSDKNPCVTKRVVTELRRRGEGG